MEESKAELQHLLRDEQLQHVPVLILGNKIDHEKATSEDFIRSYFELYGVTTGRERTDDVQRPVELFMTSVKKREGYGQGFRWLSNFMN